MARCEDYPCCGHDICPDFDSAGRQLNMRCVCGAILSRTARYSICESCMRDVDDERERDEMLERQELEDFEQSDEYF